MVQWSERMKEARILLVDDEVANLDLLERILQPVGLRHLRRTTRPEEVWDICEEFDPDLLLMDLMMPGRDGLEILRELRLRRGPEEYLPVLILTADHSPGARRRGLSAGAQDFLTKPLSPSEVRLRVRNLLETRFLHLALQDQNRLLETRVRERTAALEQARLETLERLAQAAEYRDEKTGAHTRRVAESAAAVARLLSLEEDEVDRIRQAAPLHDVGKIGIPDSILLSPRPLTAEEFATMKTHTVIGADLLSGSDFPVLRCAETIARSHHERWDGAGYPHGLAGDAIPLAGRIVAVADTFDALTHKRPYKPAWSAAAALAEIGEAAGRRFDPRVVAAFTTFVGAEGALAPV